MLNVIEYFHRHILFDADKDKYCWLSKHLHGNKLTVKKLADFGCGDGRETFALMYLLKACEGVGIDLQDTRNALSTLNTIKAMIWSKGVPDGAPEFLKAPHLEETIRFYAHDVSTTTPLESNQYDLSFSHRVLYSIHQKQGEEKALAALREMVRVVKSGGAIAVYEPTRRDHEKITFSIDIELLLRKIDEISFISVTHRPISHGIDTECFCLKK